MSDDRVHRAVSPDGTEIAGGVRGDGPPLIFHAGCVGDARIREIAGAGHFAPRTAPEAVADELIHFFATTTTAQPLARRET